MLCQIQSVTTGRRVTPAASKFALGFWFKLIHAFNSLCYSSCSLQVWDSLSGKNHLQCTKMTLADRLTRPLRLIPPAHWATKLLFLLAQDQYLFAQGSGTWVFSCPVRHQSFLSFNCIISKCGQFSLHMKNTEVLCYRLRFSHEFVTALFVADYQRFRVKWTTKVN